MSFEHYLKIKKSGPTSALLVQDKGIKVFPPCLVMRKFVHQNKNHFTQLSITFDIVFDIENYYTIGFMIYNSTHHQSQLSQHYEKSSPSLSIKKEPLYEFGNEEHFLPDVEMIKIIHTEGQLMEWLKKSFVFYEKEQNVILWNEFLTSWKYNKDFILENMKKEIEKQPLDCVEWHNIYTLFEQTENSLKV